MNEKREDLDRLDGTGIVAWLILTGVGTAGGSAIWSILQVVDDLVNPSRIPSNIAMAMLEPLLPFLITMVAAGLAAGIIIMAARAGRPLQLVGLIAMGIAFGVLIGAVMGQQYFAISVATGVVSGSIAGAAIYFIRKQVLRT